MRRLGLTLTVVALLSVPGCSDAPTAPDDSASFERAYAGHSAGRIVAVGQLREGEWKISFSGQVDIGTDGEFRGRWQTHFHSVSVPEFVGRTFVSTEIVGLGFQTVGQSGCVCRSIEPGRAGNAGRSTRLQGPDSGRRCREDRRRSIRRLPTRHLRCRGYAPVRHFRFQPGPSRRRLPLRLGLQRLVTGEAGRWHREDLAGRLSRLPFRGRIEGAAVPVAPSSCRLPGSGRMTSVNWAGDSRCHASFRSWGR